MVWSVIDIAVGFIKRYWREILIVILFLTGGATYKMYTVQKADAIRANSTITEIQRESDETTKEILLNKEQFEQAMNEKFDWLMDSLNKKPKEVEVVRYIRTTRNLIDTTEVLRIQHDTIWHSEAVYSDCGVDIKVTLSDSDAAWDIQDKSEFAIATFKNVPTWKRVFSLGLVKQKYETTVTNQCNDSIVANEVYEKIRRK